jgi:hypothetical protein
MKHLFYFLLTLLIVGCQEEEVICDTSFKSFNLYVRDTLEHVIVRDINSEYVLYSDSNVYTQFKVVDDSYLHIMGPNQQTTLNINFRYVNDSVGVRVVPICIYTDKCHINFSYPSDTLLL